MSTANIDGYMLRVKNDLSQSRLDGDAVTAVSATAAAPSHHRLTPYFERPRKRQTLKVAFSASHPAPGDVQYLDADDLTAPPASKWKGEVEVASHRTKRSGVITSRQLQVDPAPSTNLDRQIDSQFRVVARRDLHTQQWIKHPAAMQHEGGCAVEFQIQP